MSCKFVIITLHLSFEGFVWVKWSGFHLAGQLALFPARVCYDMVEWHGWMTVLKYLLFFFLNKFSESTVQSILGHCGKVIGLGNNCVAVMNHDNRLWIKFWLAVRLMVSLWSQKLWLETCDKLLGGIMAIVCIWVRFLMVMVIAVNGWTWRLCGEVIGVWATLISLSSTFCTDNVWIACQLR